MSKLIPRAVLFGNPAKTNPKISPDGKRISYVAPWEGVLNLWVKTIGLDDDKPVTFDKDRGVYSYFWAHDNKHLLYLQDVGGNEKWRLYALELSSGQIKDLTPFPNVQVRIVDANKLFPAQILIAMNEENPELHDAYLVDIWSAKLTKVAKNPGNVSEWLADADLKVRAAQAANPEGGSDLLVRKDEASDWQTLIRWNIEDGMSSGPVSFSKDGQFLYLKDSRDSDTSRLFQMDLGSGKLKLIAGDPETDVQGVVLHPDSYEPQMVSFIKERTEWRVLDPAIEPDMDAIRKIQKGDVFLASRDDHDTTWLIGFIVDDGPGAYYAYHRPTKKATFLFETRPELKNYELSPMEPVAIPARDGLTLHGYLTFPPGVPRKNLPLVLNVHGGPWVRDTWGYDPESQWVANRGYISLQINYRGSSGYGKKFLNAGNREWGGKAHDDLIDTVNWAIKKGYADPNRVAIYGGSYGGYAALCGATLTPEAFRCVVDIVGPSNLITFIKSIPPYWSVYLNEFHRRVGNPDTEPDFLKSRSPLFHVDRIKKPLLIAQGANDPRVKQAESEQIVAAMKEKKIDHEYLLFPDEGHGFVKPENRLKFYASAERFLTKHLGGVAE